MLNDTHLMVIKIYVGDTERRSQSGVSTTNFADDVLSIPSFLG